MMTDEQFDIYVDQAYDELMKKQDLLTKNHDLGKHKDFWFDQTTGILQFKDQSGKVEVEVMATPIGSFSTKSNTWQWAWANESFLKPLRSKAENLKQLVELTGFDVFQAPIIKADERMAWELAAMSVKQLNALGCYRAPNSNNAFIFLAIEQFATSR